MTTVCRRFLTPAAQKFAKHARENIQFNNEIVTAGKELADGEIDTKGWLKSFYVSLIVPDVS